MTGCQVTLHDRARRLVGGPNLRIQVGARRRGERVAPPFLLDTFEHPREHGERGVVVVAGTKLDDPTELRVHGFSAGARSIGCAGDTVRRTPGGQSQQSQTEASRKGAHASR